MPKVFQNISVQRMINNREELADLNTGTLLRNGDGDAYMAVYVYSPLRDEQYDSGMVPMSIESGDIDIDNICYPLFVIEKGERITLEQE